MALISKSFNLDMTPGVMPPVINVSEYDVNRQIIIFLRHNDGAFTPAAGTTAKIEGTLSNGFGFSEDADLSENSVSFTLTESMTAVAGRAWVKVKLTNDGAPVSSCGFIMDVDRAGVEAGTVIGASGFEQQIVDAVNDWLDEHPPAAGGMTEEIKQALLDCFEHVAWIDDQGQDYYDALYDALYPPVDVLSISAVFTQGDNAIYDTDSLDDLKQYLVVTATMSDSTTQTLEDTDYTLSGTLTEGTSTITVSYGGKTTTFNVTVTHFSNVLYQLASAFTSDGTTVESTGVKFESGKTYTIYGEFSISQNVSYLSYIWGNKIDGNSTYCALQAQYQSSKRNLWGVGISWNAGNNLYDLNTTYRFAVIVDVDAATCAMNLYNASTQNKTTYSNTYTTQAFTNDKAIFLGNGEGVNTTSGFKGTITEFFIENGEKSSAEINSYLEGA